MGEFSAAFAGECDGGTMLFLCGFCGVDNVGGVAAGADGEDDVAGLGEGFDLSGEDVGEAEVVAGGGE